VNAAKTAEPIEMQFVMLSWVGQWDHVLDEGAYWRHLVNQSINQSIIFRVALIAMPLLGHYGCYSQEMSHDNVRE